MTRHRRRRRLAARPHPQEQYATYDGQGCYDCPATRDTITVLSNPGAATEDCGEENVPGVGFGAQDLVTWMSQHRGLEVSDPEASTIGGNPAISLMVPASEDWLGTCNALLDPFRAVPILHRLGSYHWALNVGERYFITLIDLPGGTVAVMVDSADDAGLDAVVEAARPIIDSMSFPDP